MRKWLVAALAVVMALGILACNNDSGGSNEPLSGAGGYLDGSWTGSWNSNQGPFSGTLGGQVAQSGSEINGAFEFNDRGKTYAGVITGIVDNAEGPGTITLHFTQSDGDFTADMTASYDDSHMLNGSYTNSTGDSGDWSANK